MPSLFDEYRTLLQLLSAAVAAELPVHGFDAPVTWRDLELILHRALNEVAAAEANMP